MPIVFKSLGVRIDADSPSSLIYFIRSAWKRLSICSAFIIPVASGFFTAANAQTKDAPPPTNPCTSTVVANNLLTLFQRYVSNNKWLDMDGVFHNTSDSHAYDTRTISLDSQRAICQSSLSFNFIGAKGDTRHLDVKAIQYLVYIKAGRPASMDTYEWPNELNHLQTSDAFLAKWSINGLPLLPQIKAAVAANPQPTNIMDAMSMMNRAARAQAEQIARQQGFGGMIDAEAARRAKLTPQERATEDAYNVGPAPGETICIMKDGVRRCKTGRLSQ